MTVVMGQFPSAPEWLLLRYMLIQVISGEMSEGILPVVQSIILLQY